jgi:LuxR family quorum sensing-dependent transcriptional regulator
MLSPVLNDGRDAFAFIEALDHLPDAAAVSNALQCKLAQFGLDAFILGQLPDSGQKFEEAIVTERLPAEWFQIYTKEEYHRVDPILGHLRRSAKPVEWRDLRYDPERQPRAGELMGRRRDFGFYNGIVVPIHDVANAPAFLSAAGRDPELSIRTKPAIHFMTLYALERLRTLRAGSPRPKAVLTAREREVLTWAAHGKSAWEIGEILEIAKRTVDEHVQTALRKLGAVNRTQGVAIAIRDRAIEF